MKKCLKIYAAVSVLKIKTNMYLLIYRGHLSGLMRFISLKTSMTYCMTSVLSVLELNALNLALFLIMLQYYVASYFNDHS